MYYWSVVKRVKLETKLNLDFQKKFNFVSKKFLLQQKMHLINVHNDSWLKWNKISSRS